MSTSSSPHLYAAPSMSVMPTVCVSGPPVQHITRGAAKTDSPTVSDSKMFQKKSTPFSPANVAHKSHHSGHPAAGGNTPIQYQTPLASFNQQQSNIYVNPLALTAAAATAQPPPQVPNTFDEQLQHMKQPYRVPATQPAAYTSTIPKTIH